LNRPQTEDARRSIRPAYHGVTAKLQHFPLVIHWTKAGFIATSKVQASRTRKSSLPRCCPRESWSVMLSSAIFGRTCPAVYPACSSPLTAASWALASVWSLVRSRFRSIDTTLIASISVSMLTMWWQSRANRRKGSSTSVRDRMRLKPG
jgi:hypothetical protein